MCHNQCHNITKHLKTLHGNKKRKNQGHHKMVLI